MHTTIERVVAEHIETLEQSAREAAAEHNSMYGQLSDLRMECADLERSLRAEREKNAQLIKSEGDEKRGMQLLNQLRNVLKTTARGHDLVKVADSMFRELIALREQTAQPVPTNAADTK